MKPKPDLPRLRATLGDPRLARLVALLRRRLELGTALTGSITLTDASASERTASDELLGRRPTSGATLTINLDALTDMLRVAGICDDLPEAVEGLLGPIVNSRAASRERDAEWAALWHEMRHAFDSRPSLLGWIDELARMGAVKRLCSDDPARAAIVMRDVARVIDALPARAEPLAAFAARLLGNAHALDPGSPLATLTVRAAARLGEIELQGGHVMALVVKITPNDKGNPPGKLADAELHFIDGELDGLKLIGFSVWERRGGGGRNVTFPARQYSVNGDRRSFALLRPIADVTAQEKVRELVLRAYDEFDERTSIASSS